jgi:hypothetical protein
LPFGPEIAPTVPFWGVIWMKPFPEVACAYKKGWHGAANGCVWSLRHPLLGELTIVWLDT